MTAPLAPLLRPRFPALARRHQGLPVAYFDGPGGTQVPIDVMDAITAYLTEHNANTHWWYPSSIETDTMIARARAACGDFMGAHAEEIVFGANMTTLTFHLSRAIGRSFTAGDEIIVTELDHHANIDPWRQLAHERGLVVRSIPVQAEDGTLDLSAAQRLFSPRTRLLAVGAASNAIGTILDLAPTLNWAREQGLLTFVDAVHLAPHRSLDLTALGCDFAACSAYKFYGPHIGVLYARRETLAALDVPKLEPAPTTTGERLETGTQNHEGIAGLLAAIDFLASFGQGASRRAQLENVMERIARDEAVLMQRMWNGLTGIPGVRCFGVSPSEPRTPTLSFCVDGLSASAVARALARDAIFCSHGDFYATTLVRRLGHAEDGLVRAGCSAYTTADEVDRLIDAVAQIAHSRGRFSRT